MAPHRSRLAKLGAMIVIASSLVACSMEVSVDVDRTDDGPLTFDANFRAEFSGGADEATPEPGEPAGAPLARELLDAVPVPEPLGGAEPATPPIPPAPPVYPEPLVVDGAVRDALWRPDHIAEFEHVERTRPEAEERDIWAGPTFTPFTKAPRIVNQFEVERAVEAFYPRELRGSGISDMVRMYFLIDDDGTVADVRFDQRARYEAFNAAALRVAETYRFFPALNRGKAVPVWVSFPISFEAPE